MALDSLLSLDRHALARLLRDARKRDDARVALTSLDDTVFRGTTLGMPRFAERLTWKIFRKVIVRETSDGRETRRGWNVRLAQTGVQGESRPLRARDGTMRNFGPFRVADDADGAILDYDVRPNRFSVTRFVKDPLVRIGENLLLGVSNVHVGAMVFGTPTFFALQPERDVEPDDLYHP